MKLWYCLSPENKVKLARFHREKFGFEFVPPSYNGKPIQINGKIADSDGIPKLIQETPPYTITVEGHRG